MKRLFLSFIIIFFFSNPTVAQNQVASDILSIDLAETVKAGVGRNLRILAQQLETEAKKIDIEVARKVFIPRVKLEIGSLKDEKNSFSYKNSISRLANDGTRTGIQFDGNASRLDNQSHDRSLSFSLTRPLLKDFGKRVTGYEIDLKKIDHEIGIEIFKSELNGFISNLADLYYDLYFSRQNLIVQEQALERARKQYQDTRNDIDAGAIAEQEIFLVDENVVDFEVKRENALRDIAITELELKKQLNLDIASKTSLVASDSLEIPSGDSANFGEAFITLKENNPGYKVKILFCRKSGIDLEYYRNQLLPALDFQASYRLNRGNETFRRDEYRFGFQYDVPLSRSSDRSQVEKSRIEVRRSEATAGEIETNYSYDLKKVFIDIGHQTKIYQAMQKVEDLSRKKLDAETEKYRNGISTLADIVRFQRELENSTIERISTLITLNKLRIRRLLLEGTLYKEFGIDIAL